MTPSFGTYRYSYFGIATGGLLRRAPPISDTVRLQASNLPLHHIHTSLASTHVLHYNIGIWRASIYAELRIGLYWCPSTAGVSLHCLVWVTVIGLVVVMSAIDPVALSGSL